MKRILVLLGLFVAPCLPITPALASGAASDDVSWSLPTLRMDNSPLAAGDLVKSTIRAYASATSAAVLQTTDVTTPTITRSFARTGPGTICYAVTVTDSQGQESAESPRACKSIAAKPNPPTNLVVQ